MRLLLLLLLGQGSLLYAQNNQPNFDTIKLNQYLHQAKLLAEQEDFPAAKAQIGLIEAQCQAFAADTLVVDKYANRLEDLGMEWLKKAQYDLAKYSLLTAQGLFQQSATTLRIEVDRINHNLGILFYYQSDKDNTIKYFHKSLEGKKQLYGAKTLETSKVLNNLGVLYSDQGKLVEAIQHLTESYKIKQHLYGEYSPELLTVLLNIGAIYAEIQDYRKSIVYLEKAQSIIDNNPDKDIPNTGMVYNNLAAISANQSDFANAINYHQKAIAQKIKEHGPNHWEVADSYANLGAVYYENGNLEKGMQLAQKAFDIRLDQLGKDHPKLGSSYLHLGNIYHLQDSLDKAIFYQKKAIETFVNDEKENSYLIAESYLNLGASYLKQQDFENALENYEKSLAVSLNFKGTENEESARTYNAIGELHLANHQPKLAESAFNKAIRAARSQSPYVDTSRAFASFELLNGLLNKGKVLRTYHKNYPMATTCYNQATEVVKHLEKEFALESVIRLKQVSKRLYEELITIALITYRQTGNPKNLEQALHYSEKSTASLLQAQIQESNALHFADIPEELLELEYNLRIDITYYEKKRLKKHQGGAEETDTNLIAINARLFDLNQSYEKLKTQLERDFPKYFKLKYKLKTTALQNIQDSLLTEGQTLLEYFVGDSTIFAFLIKKDDYQVHAIPLDFPLAKWVNQLRQNISQPHTFNLETYAEAAVHLYQRLFKPFADQVSAQLIIIPDGILANIPFEALLTAAPENIYVAQKLPYLLHKHQISYNYSATLLEEMQHKKHRQTPSRKMLVMAPFAETDTILLHQLQQTDGQASLRSDTLTPLPGTKVESDSLITLFGADSYYGSQATEAIFRTEAPNYLLLHLATHGKANAIVGDFSYLAFAPQMDSLENELLYVRDLYNISLNADLVVLSACETGIGEFQPGEGIISLARAFAYAGAKSIATTLWQVNDQSTQEVIVSFYKYLKKEWPKDQALRQAKLDYLQAHQGSEAYPFHWAGIIGIGDMKKMK